MTQADVAARADEAVDAVLSYTVDTGTKPVSATEETGGRLQRREGTFEEKSVRIVNGRPFADDFTLDRNGFQLLRHDTAVKDFLDPAQIETIYYREVEGFVQRLTGAFKVHMFDHTLRSADEAVQEEKRLREPVSVVHNDYTDWSGPQRVRDLFPPDEAEALLKRRLAVVQLWRPIREPVMNYPLAICDGPSLSPDDLIAAERRHPDRVGEIYQVAYNPAQRWYYFPHMTRDEALVFKCYDSATDGPVRFTAHASFADPTAPADAPPRESIEARTLVFF